MEIKRYRATTAREALKQLKAELGADAIVLANRAIPGGVEIVAMPAAAVGSLGRTAEQSKTGGEKISNESRLGISTGSVGRTPGGNQAFPETSARKLGEEGATFPLRRGPEAYESTMRGERDPEERAKKVESVPVISARGERVQPASQIRPFSPPRIVTPDFAVRQEETEIERIRAGLAAMQAESAAALRKGKEDGRAKEMNVNPQIESLHEQNALLARELKAVRSLIEEQLAGFAWSEAVRRAPARARVLGEMLEAGFSPLLARQICDRIETGVDVEAAREAAKARLAARLLLVGDEDELVSKGGVYAIVGPTGVGKTTTTAKIAARCVVQLGAARVAMITTDGFRIGAQEQLRIYGRILGVPVFAVRDANDLRLTLAELTSKHVVLIDTVGLSQRDRAVAQQVAMLSGTGCVRRLLCLNAASRGDTLDDVVRAFGGEGLVGAIITKADEAITLAPVLDVAVRHRLLLHYVTNGQRVPEDLHLPNRSYLITHAFSPRRSGEDSVWSVGEEEAAVWLAQSAIT
ncbi:MAG: flagellar biosynthesis protein FlhF [Hydrogenophilus sp.]|nr:flagellar biosynthesis protein FlhF [Hydrogenophilus sp.]